MREKHDKKDVTLIVTNRNLILSLLLVSAAIYGLFSYFTPVQMDDFMFLRDYLDHNGGNASFTIDGLINNAKFLRDTDNSRLPNILWPVYGMFTSKWILALILGIAMGVVLYIGAKITSDKPLTPCWFILFWGFCIGMLPWRGGMLTGVFASNYFISSALILSYLYLLPPVGSDLTAWKKRAWCAIIVALLAGMSHEGFSIPVLTGLIFYAGIKKFRMPTFWWICVSVLAIGAIWLVTAPGMWLRLHMLDDSQSVIKFDIKIYGPNLLAFCLMILSTGVCICRHRWRIYLKNLFLRQNFTVCFVAAIMAFGLSVRAGMSLRALWAVELFSLICFVSILREMNVFGSRMLKFIGIVGFVLIMIFYANVIFWQKRINSQHDEIVAMISSSKFGTAYYDVNIYVPKTTLLHTVNTTWWEQWHLNQYNRMAPEGKIFNVGPAELSDMDVSVDSLPDMPGTAGLKHYKNCLLAHDQSLMAAQFVGQPFVPQAYNRDLTYVLADGRVYVGMPSLYSRFISPCGEKIIYVHPLHVDVTGPFKKVDFVK